MNEAIDAHKERIEILREDYGIAKGELIDEVLREIERIKVINKTNEM